MQLDAPFLLRSLLLLSALGAAQHAVSAQAAHAHTFTPERLRQGMATIDYDLTAWGTLASGITTPPVLELDEVFDQAEANAIDSSGMFSTELDTLPSGNGLAYAMNGPVVVNQSGRTAQPTTFAYAADLTAHTGEIGLGGITRWTVSPAAGGGVLLFGDFTLGYDPGRLGVGGSGWYLEGNIPPVGVVFDLLNVTVANEFGLLTISGDLCISFEVAFFLFGTPADHLVDVGDFRFEAVDRSHPLRILGEAATRLGTPPNPDVFRSGPAPRIGANWTSSIDHASFAPSATLDIVTISLTPANVPGPLGTILCGAATGSYNNPSGVTFQIPIPLSFGMIGTLLYAQGGALTPGLGVELTNALDLRIGY